MKWISEIEARLKAYESSNSYQPEFKAKENDFRIHAREDLSALLEAVRVKDEALKQCQASISVLGAIENENQNIKGIAHSLGGYSFALNKGCEAALNFTPKGFEAKGNE